jgi:hypothetical protein
VIHCCESIKFFGEVLHFDHSIAFQQASPS